MNSKLKSRFSLEERKKADMQIKEKQKQIEYDTKDFLIEHLIDKFLSGDIYIPEYQRNFIWKPSNRSSFIESVLLGLPIPFMFFGERQEDGKMEVVDGAQRLQTLVSFYNNEFKLKGLEKLDKLNRFRYVDLLEVQQRKLMNRTLRIIVLDEKTTDDVRQDLFNRINTKGMQANPSEVRRGSYPGPLTNFIEDMTKNDKFKQLCPISEANEKRHERFEFVLRFFAYVNNFGEFKHSVDQFLSQFLKDNLESFDAEAYRNDFENMLGFVEQNFPNGFAKTKTAKTTPRVRFEAIAVGVGLALREKPDLHVSNMDWLSSEEFKYYTTSDAANNLSKFRGRIEYVRDQLLKG